MAQMCSVQTVLLAAVCSMMCARTLSLPYSSLSRLTNPDVDSENNWTKSRSVSEPLPESLKLYYDLSNPGGRPSRHADALFTSSYSKLLARLYARRYLESLTGKRVNDEFLEDQQPIKRHSDAIFTDNYSRFRKQMAVKKYLNSVLMGGGKRSVEDTPDVQEESSRSEPSFPESYDEATIEELLNHLPLTL